MAGAHPDAPGFNCAEEPMLLALGERRLSGLPEASSTGARIKYLGAAVIVERTRREETARNFRQKNI